MRRRRCAWWNGGAADGSGSGRLGAAMLGAPGVVAMIEHHAMLYADLRDPVALLRGEQPETGIGSLWPYAAGRGRRQAAGV